MTGNAPLPTDIRAYHQRSKHTSTRHAPGPDFLDWDAQPSPFRSFEGARRVALPLRLDVETPAFAELDSTPPAPLDIDALGLFFELALGLSAWKEFQGERWALRNNPSSGNLHPTEGWALLPTLAGVGDSAALYHYNSHGHALEERRIVSRPPGLPKGGFLLALSSIPWRETWKYGERGFRYCQHDAGHALASAAMAAACLGWRLRALSAPGDRRIADLLGLTQPDASHLGEREHPDLLALVWPANSGADPCASFDLPPSPPEDVWSGHANRLGEDHLIWRAVELAFEFTVKPETPTLAPWSAPFAPDLPLTDATLSAPAVIRKRRSAQRMDGVTPLRREAFLRMLAQTLPGPSRVPWGCFPWPPRLALFLFVHMVEGTAPGLYALIRDPGAFDRLKAACNPGFLWRDAAADIPSGQRPPLYLLAEGDFRRTAASLSCRQSIAGKGAFSLGMVADFERTLAEEGDWAYRRLFWESGIIGQILYLEATAADASGVGIGCYFDDEFHQLFGFRDGDMEWQSVYHFAVGRALLDERLGTFSAYGHLTGPAPAPASSG